MHQSCQRHSHRRPCPMIHSKSGKPEVGCWGRMKWEWGLETELGGDAGPKDLRWHFLSSAETQAFLLQVTNTTQCDTWQTPARSGCFAEEHQPAHLGELAFSQILCTPSPCPAHTHSLCFLYCIWLKLGKTSVSWAGWGARWACLVRRSSSVVRWAFIKWQVSFIKSQSSSPSQQKT